MHIYIYIYVMVIHVTSIIKYSCSYMLLFKQRIFCRATVFCSSNSSSLRTPDSLSSCKDFSCSMYWPLSRALLQGDTSVLMTLVAAAQGSGGFCGDALWEARAFTNAVAAPEIASVRLFLASYPGSSPCRKAGREPGRTDHVHLWRTMRGFMRGFDNRIIAHAVISADTAVVVVLYVAETTDWHWKAVSLLSS